MYHRKAPLDQFVLILHSRYSNQQQFKDGYVRLGLGYDDNWWRPADCDWLASKVNRQRFQPDETSEDRNYLREIGARKLHLAFKPSTYLYCSISGSSSIHQRNTPWLSSQLKTPCLPGKTAKKKKIRQPYCLVERHSELDLSSERLLCQPVNIEIVRRT